jgi:predicted PurR-regulated permease PerM
MFLSGTWYSAIGLVIYALVLVSNVDNLTRFILQKKLADTHPLITIFGVIIGLSLFGFMGIIFGPLLLAMFFLSVNIFKQEYLNK